MKSCKRKKKWMLMSIILSLCAVLLIFLSFYHLVGKLKRFAVENVAKSAESDQVQLKTSKNSDKQNTDDHAKQSTAKKSEAGKLNKSIESSQKQNQEQENKINLSIKNQQIIHNQKVVYLTFDDGPSMLTNQILDVLNREKINATFFMIGKNVNNHLDEVKRAVHEGNYIGAHSMTHNYHRLYKQGFFVSEMEQTLSIINRVTGEKTRLVRAPYGSRPGLSLKLRNDAVNAGLKIWDWNVDTLDWENTANASTVVFEVMKQTNKNKEVILLHEKQTTLDALPEIVSFLRAKGYAFKVYNPNEHFSLNFWND
ncbi:hypothetical protein AN960_16695 [Bacillus sp. FJAT-25509]|uniref:polysaccharide deacetylase family protein n=1 Tax=Bacillus sp. FJAT-25509 TaxID=1712029 RepID=UPI0006F9B5E8|nr:polysaccharide deacetylase family protein [Bacillus sp. FJAT-25509]KQL36257.1 hypothetical protein AN960_16695 [Bacillus sp. FJAT-25509]